MPTEEFIAIASEILWMCTSLSKEVTSGDKTWLFTRC